MDTQKYTCIRKCFHRGRVWTVGESLQSPAGTVPPEKNFKAGEVKREVKAVKSEPKTFSEVNKAPANVTGPAVPETMFD